MFAIDIPQADNEEWLAVEYFDTRVEAIQYVQERYGADSEGRIGLVSEIPNDSTEPYED